MKKELRFFGEHVPYIEESAEEKEKAKQYLELWKYYLIRKLKKEMLWINVHEEQWGNRPAYLSGCLAQEAQMSLKLACEVEFKFEIPELG